LAELWLAIAALEIMENFLLSPLLVAMAQTLIAAAH
jgi:hypothetical protein